MTERDLPLGWNSRPLGEVCSVSPRDPALPSDAPFVPMNAVAVGRKFPDSYESRGSRGGVRAQGNDLLFARITPCLENGKVALLPRDSPPTGGSTEFIVIRPSKLVVPEFLYYWCLHPEVRRFARSQMAGATGRMRLSGKTLASFEFPLAPLAEQHRIVEALESHLSHLDAGLEALAAASNRLTSMRIAFDQALLDEFTSAPSVTIGEVATVGSGTTPRRSQSSYYDGGTIPWVTSGDLHLGEIFDVPGRVTELALAETSLKMRPAGTLLVAMYGEGKTRGTVAELKVASTTNQACAAIEMSEDHQDLKDWIRFILSTRYQEMRSQSSGGVQPNLSVGFIKQMNVPILACTRRQKILEESSDLLSASNRLSASIGRRVAPRRRRGGASGAGLLHGRARDQ